MDWDDRLGTDRACLWCERRLSRLKVAFCSKDCEINHQDELFVKFLQYMDKVVNYGSRLDNL